MPTTFRRYEPDQILLLPPDLRDWLPEGHLAHWLSDSNGTILVVKGRCFLPRHRGDAILP